MRRDLGDGAFILFHLAADGRLVAASGIGPGNAVARDIRLAEMLIARRAAPSARQARRAGHQTEERCSPHERTIREDRHEPTRGRPSPISAP